MNEVVKPWASKKCKFALPAELMCVVGSTIISYLLKLSEESTNIAIVGKVPTGLPTPVMPPLELIPLLAVDSIAVCIVTYSIVISLALTFAKKAKYQVRANQELFAVGLANIVGSFFSCIPLSCALSRSIIQFQTGGKTQIASVVSAALILLCE
jgi:solute carrier family 26 protein